MKPRLLADEHFPVIAITYLRSQGWDVFTVLENCPGVNDETIISLAKEQHRVILTFDRDFGELVFKQRMFPPAGIIYLRDDATAPSEAGIVVDSILRTEGFNTSQRMTVYNGILMRQTKFPQD